MYIYMSKNLFHIFVGACIYIHVFIYTYRHVVYIQMYSYIYIYIYVCIYTSIYIYIYVHLQPLQGDKESKEANPGGLVLLFLSRFVFVKSKGT